MFLSSDEYRDHANSYHGYCTDCDDVTNFAGVEGDAEGYVCEECGESTVQGMLNALIDGNISIED